MLSWTLSRRASLRKKNATGEHFVSKKQATVGSNLTAISLGVQETCGEYKNFFQTQIVRSWVNHIGRDELKYVKWIIFWIADKDMKVNMILTAEWTTEAVGKEPEKIQAWAGIEPWLLRWRDATVFLWLAQWIERCVLSSQRSGLESCSGVNF